jgi:cyclophilin family peptidyl-prolyl cis-trans isomerase
VTRKLFVTALAALIVGCGGEKAEPEPTTPPAATAAADANGCTPAQQPAPKDVKLPKPKAKLDPSKTYVATVTTNCGSFKITLDAKRAPKTGGSFKSLADQKFYDGTGFHRIVPGFVIQGGDPKGDGTGGPGYTVVETPPKNLTYTKGVVAMAKTGSEAAGTSGSQFFVVTGAAAEQLPADYALLGKISGGQDVVDKIGAIVTDPRTDRPEAPVVIESIRVSAT